MDTKTYIIGGGINGLICSYYTGHQIISENLGGQLTEKDWPLGPRFLHVDEWSKKLLDDLHITAKIKTLKIGRRFNLYGDYVEPTKEWKEKYYLKSRGVQGNTKSSSSGGKTTLDVYDIDMNVLTDQLIRNVNTPIQANVKQISTKYKILILTDGRILQYDKLIVTIPVNVFLAISDVETNLKFNCVKKLFVLSKQELVKDGYDYVYYAGDDTRFHRITKHNNSSVIEYTGNDIIPKYYDEIDRVELKNGQIIENEEKLIVKNITFLGRYAEWKHDSLINNVVEQSLQMRNNKIKICAFDLDGVLCEYPKAWIEFVNNETGNSFKNLNEIKENINYKQYKELKNKYRISGIKATLPVMENAVRKMKECKEKGYLVVILSARPVFEVKEVLRDTIFWLKNNGFEYDLLFWGKDKHSQIIKYFPNLSFMVEDNLSIANNIANLGYPVYLIDTEYNRDVEHKNVIRIKNVNEVLVQ